MSHTVTVTRTITTTDTTAILLNTGYLKTVAGALKILELILGGIAVGIVASRYRDSFLYNVPDLFFFMMATAFLICTFCLLLSCIFSLSTGELISQTIFEFIYHLVAAILLLTASVLLYMRIERAKGYYFYKYYVAAAIIGFLNACLYFFSALWACQMNKGY